MMVTVMPVEISGEMWRFYDNPPGICGVVAVSDSGRNLGEDDGEAADGFARLVERIKADGEAGDTWPRGTVRVGADWANRFPVQIDVDPAECRLRDAR